MPSTAYLESKLDALESKLPNLTELNNKLDALHMKLPDAAKLDSRLNAIETRVSELTNKDIKPYALTDGLPEFTNFIAKLESIDEFVDNKIKSINSSTNSFDNLTKHISNIEPLCTSLNNKLESTNTQHNIRPVPTLSFSSNSDPTHIFGHAAPDPKTCLILGDSNTKYVKLDDGQMLSHRIPTYLIEDIDPKACFGYKKIWIHVGTKNIKSIRCSSTDDIHRHFNTFMHKINSIRSICPHSKIIVSPITPSAILALNRRAIIFNRLLFSQKNFFKTLNFNMFCGSDCKLMSIYRSYNNQEDKIHLGSLGIKILTSKVKHCILHLDHRSYASAANQYCSVPNLGFIFFIICKPNISLPKNNLNYYKNLLHKLTYNSAPTRIAYHHLGNIIAPRTFSTKRVLFILLLNFLLITIIDSSLLNPGPFSSGIVKASGLNALYQNVQGLISFSELNKKHPNLDNTKISELHSYIHDEQPDIIVINETWLKNAVLDEEILPSNLYKIFRRDRTKDTQPPDLNNPLKFRRNGGGVLIVVSCSLKVSSNDINLHCKAEMLAVEIILDDGSKFVISICYRVGTLGISNYNKIVCALQKLLRKKRLKKLFLVGDLNLSNAN